jgi:hypothetical protein
MHRRREETKPFHHGAHLTLLRDGHEETEARGDGTPEAEGAHGAGSAYNDKDRIVCIDMNPKERVF